MNYKYGFRFLGALILLLIIGAMVFLAYGIGVNQGSSLNAAQVPQTHFYFSHPFYGAAGFFLVLFLFFALMGALRAVFGGGHRWHMRRHMMDSDFVPPMFEEWHRRAHETTKPPTE